MGVSPPPHHQTLKHKIHIQTYAFVVKVDAGIVEALTKLLEAQGFVTVVVHPTEDAAEAFDTTGTACETLQPKFLYRILFTRGGGRGLNEYICVCVKRREERRR